MIIVDTDKIAKKIILLLAYLKLMNWLIIKKLNKNIRGYIAGYMKKASINSPLTNKEMDRCKPQPIHSNPKYFLLRQGSMYSSMVRCLVNL